MINGIPADIRWLIKDKVQLAGEFSDPLISYMPGFGKSIFAKKSISIKDSMSKELLDDILRSLETHPSGYVCQFMRKLDGKPILDP